MQDQTIIVYYPTGKVTFQAGSEYRVGDVVKKIIKISTSLSDNYYDYINLDLDDGSSVVIGNVPYEFYQSKKVEQEKNDEPQPSPETPQADSGDDTTGLPAA